MKKRILSLILSLTMLASMCNISPLSASAENNSIQYDNPSGTMYSVTPVFTVDAFKIVGSKSYSDSLNVTDKTLYVENACTLEAAESVEIGITKVVGGTTLEEYFNAVWDDVNFKFVPFPGTIESYYISTRSVDQAPTYKELDDGTYIVSVTKGGDSASTLIVVGNGYSEKPISVYLNNNQVEFDVQPVIENGRTLVPVRAVLEKMGLYVGWDETTSSVTASGNGDRISIKINESYITVNSSQHYTDTPAKVIDGRTMIPIRVVVEWIGASVYWSDETRSVYINYNPARRIILKNGDTENYCYNQDENTIYMRPYQYTSITVADKYGSPVYAPEDFVISTKYNRNFIEIDEYNTLSAKVDRGTDGLELRDKKGRYWSDVTVAITDEYDYTGYRIKLRDDGVNSKAVQFDHCSGYDGMFEDSSHIYIRPHQSVAVIATDIYGKKIADSEMQNYKWVSTNEFCTIDQYGTLSGATAEGNGEIQLVDKNTNTIVSRTYVHNFNKSTHFILPFIPYVNNTTKKPAYCNLSENLLMRNMTYADSAEGCKVSFDMYNDLLIPVQISVYDKDNNRKACYITGSSWVDTGIIDGAISGFKGLPIFVDMATGKAWEDDYVLPNTDASKDHFDVTVPYGGYMAVEYPNIKNGVGNEAMSATIVDMSLKIYLEALDLGGVVKSITGDEKETILKSVSEGVLETLLKSATEAEVGMMLDNLKNILADESMQITWQNILIKAAPNIAGNVLKNTIEDALTTWVGIGPSYKWFMSAANTMQMASEAKQMMQARNLDDPTIHLFFAPTKR